MSQTQCESGEVEYFRARALQEQVAAEKANSSQARQCHDALAMMYRFKAAMLSTPADKWSDALVADKVGGSGDCHAEEIVDHCARD